MKAEINDLKQPIMIEIPFEEYKELLIIKGKYEELKSQKKETIHWDPPTIATYPLNYPTITYTDDKCTKTNPDIYPPYKITCSCCEKE